MGKDPDKVAYPIYNVLGWPSDQDKTIRGDSMNSFKATFTRAIVSSSNCKEAYIMAGINKEIDRLDEKYDCLLENKNYRQFNILEDNIHEVEKFSALTHSIGNFIVIPHKLNSARGMSSAFRDYWDITLWVLYDLFLSIGDEGVIAWKAFIRKYYLEPFVKNDATYSVGQLWKDHFVKRVYPSNKKEFEQFYRNVNILIEERGKWMTKELCNKLQITNLSFYENKLKGVERIRFFDEIDGIVK